MSYKERLEYAINAMDDLATQEQKNNGWDSVELVRLNAKREGLQLALSYFEEEERMRSKTVEHLIRHNRGGMDSNELTHMVLNTPEPDHDDHAEWEIR